MPVVAHLVRLFRELAEDDAGAYSLRQDVMPVIEFRELGDF
jgi:hypothetical protein